MRRRHRFETAIAHHVNRYQSFARQAFFDSIGEQVEQEIERLSGRQRFEHASFACRDGAGQRRIGGVAADPAITGEAALRIQSRLAADVAERAAAVGQDDFDQQLAERLTCFDQCDVRLPGSGDRRVAGNLPTAVAHQPIEFALGDVGAADESGESMFDIGFPIPVRRHAGQLPETGFTVGQHRIGGALPGARRAAGKPGQERCQTDAGCGKRSEGRPIGHDEHPRVRVLGRKPDQGEGWRRKRRERRPKQEHDRIETRQARVGGGAATGMRDGRDGQSEARERLTIDSTSGLAGVRR